ncbi:hypothetical protein D3C76_1855880 [compost metagenome]
MSELMGLFPLIVSIGAFLENLTGEIPLFAYKQISHYNEYKVSNKKQIIKSNN